MSNATARIERFLKWAKDHNIWAELDTENEILPGTPGIWTSPTGRPRHIIECEALREGYELGFADGVARKQ